MKALSLHILALEPLVLAQPAPGEENSVVGQPYIPGSALRGVVLQAYLRANRLPGLNLLENQEAHSLFFGGGLTFLNAYPAHPESWKRALPCPLSWMAKKNNPDGQVYDFAVENSPEEDGSLKSQYGCFFWKGEWITIHKPQTQVIVHNSSQDPNKKRAGTSTVYRFEAIPARSTFCGVILAQDETHLEKIRQWLQGAPITLGGSHTAGYGRVQIECEISDWQEYIEDEEESDDRITITLLSDAILRTQDGQVSADFDRALYEALSLSKPIEHRYAAQKIGLVGGFNRKWGLPLPQEWALLAGSTFTYDATSLPRKSLSGLIRDGIGERREEGFGRVGIQLNNQENFKAQSGTEPQKPSRPQTGLGMASQKLAQRTAERMLRARFDRGLVQAINRIELEPHSIPKTAQLSRLRSAAGQAQLQRKLDPISQHLKNLKTAGSTQLEQCRLKQTEGQRLSNWLEERLERIDVLEQFGIAPDSLPMVAGVKAELSPELKAEYMARFLEGVFRKAAKQKQPREEAK